MSFLDKIVASRSAAVTDLKQRGFDATAPGPVRDFKAALVAPGMSIIAEIKRRSPSKGDLNPSLDPASMAKSYQAGGARAVSVLTEPEFFDGSPEDLEAARSAIDLPVLWKDFVLDPVQIAFARSCGADAVLLIVRMTPDTLDELIREAKDVGVTALVEIFDESDLERALEAGAEVVGVNHRDLSTFEEDPTATKRLRPLVPDDVVLVAESAISTRSDIEALESIGVGAALIGEAIVTSTDPVAKISELLGRSNDGSVT